MVAPTTIRVVQFAGGWLFDRVLAGWDVVVHVSDHADARPLRILGARAVDLEQTLSAGPRGPRPQAIAIDAELCRSDARVQGLVREAVGECATEVRLWGEGWPLNLDGETGSVCHRLSVAARAFKTQALMAAAAPAGGSVGGTETFQTSDGARRDAPASDRRLPAEVV